MQGLQVITAFFDKYGISHIFQLPGLHTLGLNSALFRQQRIKTITARHETNLSFMADGYARASGKPGFILVTPGPGLGNIVSGCMEAFSDDVPVFILHIDTGRQGIGKGILHELNEPENIFRHFIKKTWIINDTASIFPSLEDAYRTCTTGRTGPVLLSIPFGLLEKDAPLPETAIPPTPQPTGTSEKRPDGLYSFLSDLTSLLKGKQRPVMIGGKGLMSARAEMLIEEICGLGRIPLLTTTGGKGIVTDRHLFSFGNIIAKGVPRDILGEADLVIAAGTRLRDVDAKRRGVKIGDLVHIDIDDRWIDRNYKATLAFTGDPVPVLQEISDIIQKRSFCWDLEGLKKKQLSEAASLKRSAQGYALIDLLRKAIPETTAVVCDLNIPSYWAEYYLPVYSQRSFIMPRGISPIFYSLSAAIGACLARPQQPCLALCGDGGVLPQTAELATIVRYNIPVVIFIHNNNSYSILEDAMRSRYGINGSMMLANPEFVMLARSFGIKAKRTHTLTGLRNILLRDIRWDEPFVVEFVDRVSSPPWS